MEVIAGLSTIAARYDAVVLDQWGVLHDGTAPYPGAVDCLARLLSSEPRVGVLSNSGKRAGPNAKRIAAMGLPIGGLTVTTSGEALWTDLAAGRLPVRAPCILAATPADATAWADGLGLAPASVEDADAMILMGRPETGTKGDETVIEAALDTALARDLPVYCSNPDLTSPRSGGRIVASPGALAAAHASRGGRVTWYGKPHGAVFRACAGALGLGDGTAHRILMVGDSAAHDVAGGHAAGWDTCLVTGGLLGGAAPEDAAALCEADGAPAPTWAIATLQW